MCKKPPDLVDQNSTGGRPNGYDLSGNYMAYAVLKECRMIRTNFEYADLLTANFSDSCLVEADFSRASLYEANFSGADVSGAIFVGADVTYADFRSAHGLTCEQLTSAKNWVQARRDPKFACGGTMDFPLEKSLGQRFREGEYYSRDEMYSNPDYPYRLVTFLERRTRQRRTRSPHRGLPPNHHPSGAPWQPWLRSLRRRERLAALHRRIRPNRIRRVTSKVRHAHQMNHHPPRRYGVAVARCLAMLPASVVIDCRFG